MDPEDPEHKNAGCICQRWPMLVFSLAFFLLGAVGLVTAYALLQDKALEHKNHFGVVIDAGSSHTDISVYKWPSSQKYQGTAKVKQIVSTTCSSSGISSYKDDPKVVTDIISGCIESVALKTVPKNDRKITPLYLGATAGMRLLCARDKNSCDNIMLAVNNAFKKYKFKHNNRSARILTGKEEGTFGWITVNLLKKSFFEKKADEQNEGIVGALDMGGGSAEIAFIPKSGTAIPNEYKEELRIYGKTYSIYTHSFLCYGMKEAERRLLAGLVQRSNFSSKVVNPCYPDGFSRTETAKNLWLLPCSMKPNSIIFPVHPLKEYQLTGSGDYEECKKSIRNIFNETKCRFQTCSFNGAYQPYLRGTFLAFSGYGYVGEFLNLSEKDSIEKLSKAGKQICKEKWRKLKEQHPSTPDKFLHKYCFDAEYINQILTYGFHFKNDTKQVTFTNKVNGTDVGWSLGFIVNATNLIPNEQPKGRLTRDNYLFLTGISVIIVAFSIVLCFCYSVKKCRKSEPNYKPLNYIE